MVESGSATVPVQELAGVTATITDAIGAAHPLALGYAGPSQVNFLVPDGIANGSATVNIGAVSGSVTVSGAAPGLFSLGASKTAAGWRFACKKARLHKPRYPPLIAAAERAAPSPSPSTINRPCTSACTAPAFAALRHRAR